MCNNEEVFEWYSNTIPLQEAPVMQNTLAFNKKIASFFTFGDKEDCWDLDYTNTFAPEKS